VKDGVQTVEQVQALSDEYRTALDNGLHVVQSLVKEPNKELFGGFIFKCFRRCNYSTFGHRIWL